MASSIKFGHHSDHSITTLTLGYQTLPWNSYSRMAPTAQFLFKGG